MLSGGVMNVVQERLYPHPASALGSDMSTVLPKHGMEPSPIGLPSVDTGFPDLSSQHVEQNSDIFPVTARPPAKSTTLYRRHSAWESTTSGEADGRELGGAGNDGAIDAPRAALCGRPSLHCTSTAPAILSLGQQNKLRKPQFRIKLPFRPLATGLSFDGISEDTPSFVRPMVLTPPEEITQPQFPPPESLTPHLATLTPSPEANPTLRALDVTEEYPAVERTDEEMNVSQQGASAGDSELLSSTINLVVETVITKSEQTNAKRLVVQILPQPASEQDPSLPVSLFQTLLDRLLTSRPLTPRWLSAVHAVPKNYPVDALPTSASSTPVPNASFAEATDYFTLDRGVVHTSAYMADQYDVFAPRSVLSTPGLASSPKSVDVALYQRVIPPSTAKEVSDLFDAAPGSALTDRLRELAPNGCLLFFYPTANGAWTFKRDYLDRALASLVRSVILGKGLPSTACASIANVAAIGAMLEFDEMQTKLNRLLRDMQASPIFDGASFSIISGVRANMELPRKIWKQWWIKQEQLRVKAVIEHHFKQVASRGQVFHKDERYTARGIANEILTGMSRDSYEEASASAPPPPVEVGVFVIKRNT